MVVFKHCMFTNPLHFTGKAVEFELNIFKFQVSDGWFNHQLYTFSLIVNISIYHIYHIYHIIQMYIYIYLLFVVLDGE